MVHPVATILGCRPSAVIRAMKRRADEAVVKVRRDRPRPLRLAYSTTTTSPLIG